MSKDVSAVAPVDHFADPAVLLRQAQDAAAKQYSAVLAKCNDLQHTQNGLTSDLRQARAELASLKKLVKLPAVLREISEVASKLARRLDGAESLPQRLADAEPHGKAKEILATLQELAEAAK